ncbi:MAG: hypothetical protein B7Y26_00775 [Hydrogenophilales bacterium 16-64-46]|nr:MAG: hypothetical protein B7Z32_10175 [Hydrogenophilales bacterium 12-64-13]OYZ07155.1 MAG: hypothetical protein B7Y26_00775 [Hydrogenophilales bacterium 16-64-46]OZA37376.1 MAG: hypothetical protein B7X87_11710 [Hydrogenophilales bacterium 17-64-34]HQT00606.1 hypothetical protein [Thiobacillus sp.]
MNNLLHRNAIPALNAAHDTGAVLLRLFVAVLSLAWLAAGFFVWSALVLLALLVVALRLPFVLARRLIRRQP